MKRQTRTLLSIEWELSFVGSLNVCLVCVFWWVMGWFALHHFSCGLSISCCVFITLVPCTRSFHSVFLSLWLSGSRPLSFQLHATYMTCRLLDWCICYWLCCVWSKFFLEPKEYAIWSSRCCVSAHGSLQEYESWGNYRASLEACCVSLHVFTNLCNWIMSMVDLHFIFHRCIIAWESCW